MALTTIDDRGLKTPIDLLDNEKIRFGTGNDLEIYHDGNNNYIVAGQSLFIKNDYEIQFLTTSNEKQLVTKADGAVELYYDGSKTFETISGGAKITGHFVPSGTCNLGTGGDRFNDLYIGNDIVVSDNGKLILGTGNDLQIYHDSTNGNNKIQFDQQLLFRSHGSGGSYENSAAFNPNGSVDLYYNDVKKFETTSTGVTISSSSATELKLTSSTSSSASIEFGDTDDDDEAQIWYDNYSKKLNFRTSESSDLVFYRDDTEKIRITSDGLTFNGDTAAANALDDYEEGTFTPTIDFGGASTGITYQAATGATYTKIGRAVNFRLYIALSSQGSASGNAKIFGLPFTSAGSNGYNAVACWDTNMEIPGSPVSLIAYVNPGSNYIALNRNNESNGDANWVTESHFNNNSEIMISGNYIV